MNSTFRLSRQGRLLGLLLAIATGLSLPGCGGDSTRSQPAESQSTESAATKLMLYCGAGIRPAAADLAKQFGQKHGVTVECDYAGSEVLMGRIKLTGQGDLYMPGDVHYVEQAEKQGLVSSKKNACYFVPVILVAKGNPKNIRSLEDLLKPGVKIGLGDTKACAIGRKSSKIFAKNGIDEEDVHRNVVFRSLTVNALGNHVKMGMLDAAIVWDAMAAYFADKTDKVVIPVEKNAISTVAIGVLSCSKHGELAEQFAAFVASDEGREIFKKHNYTVEQPK